MIAVVGVGAIGGTCAAHLLGAGRDVVCCAREPFETLELETPVGRIAARPRVVTDPSQTGPVEWLLFATKAHQTEGAAGWLEAGVGPATHVAVLQNGVEHVERLSPWVPADRLLPVVVQSPADRTAPGRVVQRRAVRLVVPDGGPGRDFACLFAETAVEVQPVADWSTEAWRKLCLNVATGAVAALAGKPIPEIRTPGWGELALAIALECTAVARAEGADLTDAWAEAMVEHATRMTTGGSPSTLADRLAGRPLEVDARNGAVVRIGARHGIETPVNAAASLLMANVHEDPATDLLAVLAARVAWLPTKRKPGGAS